MMVVVFRHLFLPLVTLATLLCTSPSYHGAWSQDSSQSPSWPHVDTVDRQPLLAHVNRLSEAMEVLGTPWPAEVQQNLRSLTEVEDTALLVQKVQQILDPLCLLAFSLPETGRPVVTQQNDPLTIAEQGWTTFLVKVVNPKGRTERLMMSSPNALPLPHAPANEVASRWMQFSVFEGQPLRPNLSGLELEYRVVQIFSRDAGEKKALIEFALSGPGKKSKDQDVAGSVLKEWRFNDDTAGWQVANQAELHAEDGALIVKGIGEDPFIVADVQADAGPMMLRFWAKSDVDGMGQIFWWTDERPQPDGQHQSQFLLQPGRDTLYEVPFNCEGQLAGIRLDSSVKPGTLRIDWIDLVSARKSSAWSQIELEFNARPAALLTFRVRDAQGQPTIARFEVTDQQGNVFPPQSKRLAPDFFFQRQIYRGDGETLALPLGTYQVKCLQGPESIPEIRSLDMTASGALLDYQVQRWIDPTDYGYWSGDHHIHAAGCLHYENPTQGVHPPDMLRHIMGEDVKVGCCLTWGPCFDYQKRFFTGKVNEQSRYPYLLRYDVEVSGFGSHQSGHLNLLNLKEQIYPGGESKDHWPTLGLNTLRWAKAQGAVCGPAHSALGLTRFVGRVPDTEGLDGPNELPHYNIPAYDGIGANEFIVDVTHQVPGPDGLPVPAIDFISAMNTQRTAEWNMWYHVLNAGMRVAISGETDFPCITGEGVGIGRVYVQLDEPTLTYDRWVKNLAAGRSYVSDGTCHLLNFTAKEMDSLPVSSGQQLDTRNRLVTFSVSAAMRADHSQEIPVELIVNGYAVQTQIIPADGNIHPLSFDLELEQSSWVAIRCFPFAHTNPIYVVLEEEPILPSRASLLWCLMGVEQCWTSKQRTYAIDEQEDARKAYQHARETYSRLLSQFDNRFK